MRFALRSPKVGPRLATASVVLRLIQDQVTPSCEYAPETAENIRRLGPAALYWHRYPLLAVADILVWTPIPPLPPVTPEKSRAYRLIIGGELTPV